MQRVILVVEHDAALRGAIAHILRGDGYFVLAVPDGALAIDVARYNPIALVLLDPTYLQPSGLDICRELRASAETAHILILMMVADESEITQMMTLEPGVDDYIMGPLMWRELRACVQALLSGGRRRTGQMKGMGSVPETIVPDEEQVLIADDLCIDIARHRVTRGNRPIELHRVRLFDLLVYLVRHRGIVLTRDRLLKEVWRFEQVNDVRTVDTHMRWLRQKLEDDPDHPQLIETVRGVGYRFKD